MERVARILDTIVEHCGRITAWASLAIVLVMAYNVYMTVRQKEAVAQDNTAAQAA